MASYKQTCIHCGMLVDRDVRVCSACGSRSPFGYLCPSCLRPVYVACPFCGKPTFVQERCEQCGQELLVRCGNKRCGAAQFFENTRCTACGKKIKAKIGNR